MTIKISASTETVSAVIYNHRLDGATGGFNESATHPVVMNFYIMQALLFYANVDHFIFISLYFYKCIFNYYYHYLYSYTLVHKQITN